MYWNDFYPCLFFCSLQNISDGQLHQIWYEDELSSSFKINLAKSLNLKGKKLLQMKIWGTQLNLSYVV